MTHPRAASATPDAARARPPPLCLASPNRKATLMIGPIEGVPYCRTCRRALNTHTAPSGQVTYRHTVELRGAASDHPADPAPVTELPDAVMQCDFCSQPHPAWTYVCADQHTHVDRVTARIVDARDYRNRHGAARVRRTETTPGITQAWGQRWAACEGCATLIDTRDVYGLISRVAEAMPAKLVRGNRLPRVRAELHATYSVVFATLAPGRGRITVDHPLGVWEAPDEPAPAGGEDEAHGAAPAPSPAAQEHPS